MRKGLNDLGKTVCYFLNYSGMELEMPYDYKNGIELLENTAVENGTALQMPAWGVKIVEEAEKEAIKSPGKRWKDIGYRNFLCYQYLFGTPVA